MRRGGSSSAGELRDRSDVVAYFDELLDAFELAATRTGRHEQFFRMGNEVVRLCFAGDALAESLTAAIAHLEVPPVQSAALTISIWDSRSSSVEMLPPRWSNEHYGARGEINGFESHGFFIHYEIRTEALTMIDLEAGRAIFWVRDASRIPWWESVSPFRVLLNRWADHRGMLALHAAGVGTADGGAILVGGCGSGKSTTAFACVDGAFRHAGDDTVLVVSSPAPTVHSVYSTAKLTDWSLARFPHLRGLAERVPGDADSKSIFFLHRVLPKVLIDRFPLKAILLPTVTGESTTRFLPAPRGSGVDGPGA